MKKTFMFILFILLSYSFFSTIINVPAEQPTIQDGINVAVDGDTILVQPGTYVENINVKKSITIKSVKGREKTIVQAKDSTDHVFHLKSKATIDGFTIQGAVGENASGIYAHGNESMNTTITANKIFANRNGIYLENCDSVKIINNEPIAKNRTNGLFLKNLRHSQIKGNVINKNLGAGVKIEGNESYEIKIIGNYIGTDKNGSENIGNFSDGIHIHNASYNIIGGVNENERNII